MWFCFNREDHEEVKLRLDASNDAETGLKQSLGEANGEI
jgi:hypothetical protein